MLSYIILTSKLEIIRNWQWYKLSNIMTIKDLKDKDVTQLERNKWIKDNIRRL
jgi:hypothetical protein